MKKFLLSFALSASVFADIAIYNPSSTGAVSVIQVPAKIQQVSIANAAGSATTVTFYDAPTNSLTWVSGAYTNSVASISNVVTTFTNITGVVQSQTNQTLVFTPTLVNAATNNYRTVLVQTIPAGSTITYTPPQGQPVGFGLACTTSATNVVATITYLPTR